MGWTGAGFAVWSSHGASVCLLMIMDMHGLEFAGKSLLVV